MASLQVMSDKAPAEILRVFLDRESGRKSFLEHEVKELLREAGLRVPKGIFVPRGEVLSSPALDGLSFPLVAKVSSSGIASKSDVKGIRLGLKDEGEVHDAISGLSHIERAEGVLLEETAPAGLEVIVGGIVDNQFGPVVMFGLGGIFVELFRDVSFGLAPLGRDEAFGLISRVRAHRLLEGYRGRPPIDMDSLLDIIVVASELVGTGLLEEIDLNPVALYPDGAMVLDAKMLRRALP